MATCPDCKAEFLRQGAKWVKCPACGKELHFKPKKNGRLRSPKVHSPGTAANYGIILEMGKPINDFYFFNKFFKDDHRR